MSLDLNRYYLYFIMMLERPDEHRDNILTNPQVETNIIEEVEPIKRGRGRPKT